MSISPVLPDSSSALLSTDADSSSKSRSRKLLFIFLLVTASVAISAAVGFGFLFFPAPSAEDDAAATFVNSASSPHDEVSRPLSKLKKPVVLIVSSDGFRYGYQHKTHTPNIHRLIKEGTEAQLGLIPVFPTLTFPNHYSIATGLYPAHHGIVNNYFTDPATGEGFSRGSHDPKWWLGEPLWMTAANHGVKAATLYWAGSEVKKGKWDCPRAFCPKYNASVPFEERADTILSYFDLPDDEIPSLMMLYLSEPDSQGHKYGPDDPRVTKAISGVDKTIGRLIRGLKKRKIYEDVTFILLGDHGMVGTCRKKLVALDDLAKWIEIPPEWVETEYPVVGLRPSPGTSLKGTVDKIKEALNSGEVENGEYMKVYLKEELPSRLHYSGSDRIPPIILLLDEGFMLEQKRSTEQECSGAHGYDNSVFSMRTIFIARGPRFARGRKVPSFENVQIYNVVTTLLDLPAAPNNGSAWFRQSILLPSH